ncbi:MAG: histidine kinase, partial [Deltaproteobacteria bacterium]|nr:histidine kinase [Nannocystaceae bacterium]
MPPSRSLLRRALGELAGYVLLAAVLTAVLAGFVGMPDLAAVLAVFVFDLVVALSIGALIELAHRAALPRLGLESRSTAARVVVHAAIVGAATYLGVEIAFVVAALLVPEVAEAFPRAAVLRVAIPVSIAMVVIGRERERMRRRATEAELGAEQLERQVLHAELAALRSRTNPHFLFNALNTIAALVAEDPAGAERAIERLAALLRYALDGAKRSWVPLAEEVAAIEGYLELERLRYGERLCVRVDVELDCARLMIPPMLLQPLVENAVLHAVASRRGPTRIELRARRVANGLELVVDDDGPGPDGSTHRGNGLA